MGILYEKFAMTQELKKLIMIRQLVDMGIREHRNKSIYELNYYELLHLLATTRNIESAENRWF